MKPKLLCVIAGHGGIKEAKYVTPGKRSKDLGRGVLPEGQMNRVVGHEVILEMYMRGYPVHFVNPENEDIRLSTRVNRVNKLTERYNVFCLDLHSNYADNPKAHGYEIFSSLNETRSDRLGKDIFYKKFKEHFPEKHFRVNTPYDPIKDKKFAVVTGTRCPCLLLENFFNLSNQKEYLEALDPCFRERLVMYICDCLEAVYKVL
jgi:N-acetylmuramoyl-L-alanine amidase